MRRMMVAILGVLGLAGPTAGARAHWEYANWGMTPEQVVQASRGAATLIPSSRRRRQPEINVEHAAEGTYADGALRLEVRFGFDTRRGGLALVVYGVADAAQNDLLKAWLIRKYGPPHSNSGLPAIGLQTLNWRGEDEINVQITEGERAFVLHSQRKPGG